MRTDNSKDYSYDNRGNLTEIRCGDKIFNTYTFDATGKLIEATDKFTNSTAYTYDGLGRRVKAVIDLSQGFGKDSQTVTLSENGRSGNTKTGGDKQAKQDYMIRHYVVDYTAPYNNMLMSYGKNSQTQRYTYGLDLISMDFQVLAGHDNGRKSSVNKTVYDQWETLYYLHDEMGSVVRLTGSNGKTSAHYNYDEFGCPLGEVKLDANWPGPDNQVAYTGYIYDNVAGLYYAQARYYMPETGRFTSPDPWAGDLTLPGTLNPYPYVLNNSMTLVDPLGLWACDQYDDFIKGLWASGGDAIKELVATPFAMFELVQAIRNGELSLDDLKQALGESFEPARHVFNESGTVIFGEPSDSQVFEYGRNFGAVLQAAVSGGGAKIIAKAAPKAAKILSAKGAGEAAGLVGKDFENFLVKKLGGEGSFSVGGREFDGAIGNIWYEAKSGNYWEMVMSSEQKLNKFKSDMGDRLRIARENNATYELHSNTPIPPSVKEWLSKKEINFTEW